MIEDVMLRRSQGESLSDAEVEADHPDLMPELARELRLLAVLHRAAAQPRPPRPTPLQESGPPDSQGPAD